MQPVERNVKGGRHMQSQRSQNGMPLRKERIQRPPEPIVIKLAGGNAPQQIGPTGFGPFADIGQRDRRIQPRRRQRTEHTPMIKLSLRIGGQMPVDDFGKINFLNHRFNHRERTKRCALDVG